MSARSSSASYNLRSLATLLICRYKVGFGSTVCTPGHQHISSGMKSPMFGYGIGSSMHQRLSISSANSIKREQDDTLDVQMADPNPPRPGIFSWVKWVLGSILPLLLSFWNEKWGNLLKLEGRVEKVVKEAEEVAEVVEKVASTTEKLSAEVAENLDNGELKEVAMMVEHISSITAKDARITQNFIHKVGDLKQDVTDLENMVEPVIDKIEHGKM